MDDTLLFIPPCCVDKKLPKAITQAPRYALTFYTHGDVTMEKFYRAVSYLVQDAHVMVLSMPTLSLEAGAFVAQCFERKWITDLVLSTRSSSRDVVERFFKPYERHVLSVRSTDVSDLSSHLVLYTPQQALILQGPMFNRANTGDLTAYFAQYIPHFALTTSELDWGNPLRNILLPDVLRHRQQIHKEKRPASSMSAKLARFVHMDFPPYKTDDE